MNLKPFKGRPVGAVVRFAAKPRTGLCKGINSCDNKKKAEDTLDGTHGLLGPSEWAQRVAGAELRRQWAAGRVAGGQGGLSGNASGGQNNSARSRSGPAEPPSPGFLPACSYLGQVGATLGRPAGSAASAGVCPARTWLLFCSPPPCWGGPPSCLHPLPPWLPCISASPCSGVCPAGCRGRRGFPSVLPGLTGLCFSPLYVCSCPTASPEVPACDPKTPAVQRVSGQLPVLSPALLSVLSASASRLLRGGARGPGVGGAGERADAGV